MSIFHRYYELPVDNGRVSCPFKLDKSVASCLKCPRIMALRLGGPHPTITCLIRPVVGDEAM